MGEVGVDSHSHLPQWESHSHSPLQKWVGPTEWDSQSLPILITALNISHLSLTGSIPSQFGHLSSLQILDLSYNRLSGAIPSSIFSIYSLKYLDLSDNQLSGPFPSFIYNMSSVIGVDLTNVICNSFPYLESLHLIGNVFLGEIRSTLSKCIHLKRLSLSFNHFSGGTPKEMGNLTKLKELYLSYNKLQELSQATEGFSETNLMGTGSFGPVYKARLVDGMEVAVKSFDTECEVLKSIRYRNLVKIISGCSSNNFKALVLEYMPNGSLEERLYSNEIILDIFQRLNIMINVASALEYLHFGHLIPVIHCDLKSSNVLLDDNMVAHLSDFGIAKLLNGEDQSMMRTQTLAIIGYMSPEYRIEGRVSTKADAYAYGIMLMETFSGKKPTSENFGGEMTLYCWEQRVSSIFKVALECTIELPEKRINTREI
ncbi:hypothetical protein CICLE_v10027121mg, partial [Citrus x clementina]